MLAAKAIPDSKVVSEKVNYEEGEERGKQWN